MSILNSLISIVSLNSQKHSIAYSSASFSNGDNFGLNHVSKLNKQTNTQTHNGPTITEMSFFDEEIKKSIWDGKIPIIFTLSPNDLTSHIPPSPYSLMAPRNSYFPLITNVVKEHFKSSTLVLADEMWLEYNGVPIKWHIPIGVLYDSLVGGNNKTSEDDPNQGYWNLVVHFQSYPDKILKCPNEEYIKTHYKNVLKEANYIKQGDITKLNNLNINQTNELWDGLKYHDYDKFWSINKKFYPNSTKEYKYIPIRIIYNCKPPVQELIPVFDENGEETTLQMLFNFIPFQNVENILGNSNSSSNSNSNNNDDNDDNNNNNVSKSDQVKEIDSKFKTLFDYLNSGVKYKIQGIEPDLSSSVVWLNEFFGYPDNFLYIVLLDPISK
ncbi:hypothetical protein CYY_005752 [Polysphondylium violaceum]|uniref:Autophagy protein 5 n=1 Tax=Polysphondylium violaceum TaxID=133409 RepID=A0A8J4UYJ7_9MYCE|nr:hypothetical protein CYY_005752 [Polysphondylium violaceum]